MQAEHTFPKQPKEITWDISDKTTNAAEYSSAECPQAIESVTFSLLMFKYPLCP